MEQRHKRRGEKFNEIFSFNTLFGSLRELALSFLVKAFDM